MKILQVIPYFCFGGAEVMCENLCYALKQLGHELCVVSLYAERTPISQRMEAAGITIEYLDKKLGLDVSMVPKLTRIMKREKPDVVHTHLAVIKYAVAAAKLACAYLHGVYDGGDKEHVCCAKDLDKAHHYGVLACMGEDEGQILVNGLDDRKVEDQKFLSEVAQEAGLE